jgi:DNA-directed RNA polymerase subunit L
MNAEAVNEPHGVRTVRNLRYPGDETLKRASGESERMELRVIEKTDTELHIEIAGEDHTFMNVLKGALLEADDVAAATYDMNPEQSGGQTEPVLTVKAESGDPLDVLADAAGSITDRTAALRDAVKAA